MGSSYLQNSQNADLDDGNVLSLMTIPSFFRVSKHLAFEVFFLNKCYEINWYKANNLDPWKLNLFFSVLQMVNISLTYRLSIIKQCCYWIGIMYTAIWNWKWSWSIYEIYLNVWDENKSLRHWTFMWLNFWNSTSLKFHPFDA